MIRPKPIMFRTYRYHKLKVYGTAPKNSGAIFSFCRFFHVPLIKFQKPASEFSSTTGNKRKGWEKNGVMTGGHAVWVRCGILATNFFTQHQNKE